MKWITFVSATCLAIALWHPHADPEPTRYPYPVQTVVAGATATSGAGTAVWLTAYATWLNATPAAPWPFAQDTITATATTTPTLTATATSPVPATLTAFHGTRSAIEATWTSWAATRDAASPAPSTTPTSPPGAAAYLPELIVRRPRAAPARR